MINLDFKLETIAVYDNWLIIPEGTYNECHRGTTWVGHGGKFNCYHDVRAIQELQYLTCLNQLHPVAMKVKNKLSHMKNTSGFDYTENLTCTSLYNFIMKGCTQEPNENGEYTDLFEAVYQGILFINQYKK